MISLFFSSRCWRGREEGKERSHNEERKRRSFSVRIMWFFSRFCRSDFSRKVDRHLQAPISWWFVLKSLLISTWIIPDSLGTTNAYINVSVFTRILTKSVRFFGVFGGFFWFLIDPLNVFFRSFKTSLFDFNTSVENKIVRSFTSLWYSKDSFNILLFFYYWYAW